MLSTKYVYKSYIFNIYQEDLALNNLEWLIAIKPNQTSDLTDKMKRSFFQAAVVLILLYGCTTWTLTKRLKKKLDGNHTRMLRAILNKSWRQHPTRHQLYSHLPPIMKTIQVRRTRYAGHCWRSRDELISDVLLWTPTYGRAKAGWPARTYIQQLCEDTGCIPEDLPEAMNDREKWLERARDLALNKLQGLIYHKTQHNPTQPNLINLIYMYKEDLALKTSKCWYAIKPNLTVSYLFNIYV